jgi:hypothetical protein
MLLETLLYDTIHQRGKLPLYHLLQEHHTPSLIHSLAPHDKPTCYWHLANHDNHLLAPSPHVHIHWNFFHLTAKETTE